MARRRIVRWLSVLLILYIVTSVYFFTKAMRSTTDTEKETDLFSNEENINLEKMPIAPVMKRRNIYIEENYQSYKSKTVNHHKGRIIKMARKPTQQIPIFLTTTKQSTYSKKTVAPKSNQNLHRSHSDQKMAVLNGGGKVWATSLKDLLDNLQNWKDSMNQALNEWSENALKDLEFSNKTVVLSKTYSNRSLEKVAPETMQFKWEHIPEKLKSIPFKVSELEDSQQLKITDRKFDKLVTKNVLPTYNVNFQRITDDTFVYAVYLDERKSDRFLRIVLISKAAETEKNMLCKFSVNGNFNTVDSKITFYETCENHMKSFSTFLASCQVPKQNISLGEVLLRVDEKRKTDIHMKVINGRTANTEMKTFGVCVPPLFGNVSVLRLTEFIELSRILGAEYFVFYTKDVSPAITMLLDYYKSLNIVTVMPWHLTIPKKDIWYHGQSAAIWDCLYRTMFKFKHVAFLDIDEYIIPQNQNTIPELLDYLQKEENVNNDIISGYRFFSAFFDSSFPGDDRVKSLEIQQFVTLNSTVRTRRFSKLRTKLIVNPQNVFELGIHHISKPNEEYFEVYTVTTDVAFIHHYRKCDTTYGMNCKLRMTDNRAVKYQRVLVNHVKELLYKVRKFKRNISN